MPTPRKGESKKKYIKRCIPALYDEPGTLTAKGKKKNKQAFAICNSMYDRKNEHVKTFEQFVNEALYEDKPQKEKKCPNCGNEDVEYFGPGEYVRRNDDYIRLSAYQCKKCKKIFEVE